MALNKTKAALTGTRGWRVSFESLKRHGLLSATQNRPLVLERMSPAYWHLTGYVTATFVDVSIRHVEELGQPVPLGVPVSTPESFDVRSLPHCSR